MNMNNIFRTIHLYPYCILYNTTQTGTTNSKLKPIRYGIDFLVLSLCAMMKPGTNFAAADDLNQVSLPPFPFFLRFLVLVRPPLKIIQCDDDLLLTEHFITEDDILLCESWLIESSGAFHFHFVSISFVRSISVLFALACPLAERLTWTSPISKNKYGACDLN